MSQTELIMIDDTDSSIKYTGSWIPDKGSVDNLGNYGAPYMSTNHYIKGTGSFTFTFSGTYVGVFGTTVDGTDPKRQCTVDGAVIPNNQLGAAENGVMHCQVNGLADKTHTLVVTVGTANPSGYWFDYIQYIPSASVSRTNAVMNIINGDPSMAFGSGWARNGPGYAATSNGATFNMQFTGRTLIWLGYYLSQNKFAATTATWSVDGSSPVTFNINGIKSQSTGAEFNQRLFTTGVLPAGKHNLKVVYNGNSNTTPLSIYQVLIQNGNMAGVPVGGISGGGSAPPSAPQNPTTSKQGTTAASGSASIVSNVNSASPSTVTVTNSETQAPVVTTIVSVSGGSTIVDGGSTIVSAGSTIVTGGSTIVTGGSTVLMTETFAAAATPTPSVTVIGTGADAITITIASNAKETSISGPVGLGNSTTGLGDSNINGNGNTTGATGKTTSHTGAILGSVIGIVVILLLLLALFYMRRRRAKRVRPISIAADIGVDPFLPPPTGLPPTTAGRSFASPTTAFSSSSESEYSSNAFPHAATYTPYTDEKREPPANHAPSASLSTVFSSPSTVPNRPESELIVVHEDSGLRLPATRSGRPIVEMPPTYSAT